MDTTMFHSLLYLWGTYIGLINSCQVFFTDLERNKLLNYYDHSSGLYSLYSRYFKLLDIEGLRGIGVFSVLLVLMFSYLIVNVKFPSSTIIINIIIIIINLITMTAFHYYLLNISSKYKYAKEWRGLFIINIAAFISIAPKIYLYFSIIIIIILHIVIIYNIIT